MERTTPDNITSLQPNEVFVFGSNTAGRHGKGAAKFAMGFGAKLGQGDGLQGNTYGISTKDGKLRVLTLNNIGTRVHNFIQFAKAHPELTFLVTEIGCGLAGYKPKEIAPLFADAMHIENIHLPKKFWHALS